MQIWHHSSFLVIREGSYVITWFQVQPFVTEWQHMLPCYCTTAHVYTQSYVLLIVTCMLHQHFAGPHLDGTTHRGDVNRFFSWNVTVPRGMLYTTVKAVTSSEQACLVIRRLCTALVLYEMKTRHCFFFDIPHNIMTHAHKNLQLLNWLTRNCTPSLSTSWLSIHHAQLN